MTDLNPIPDHFPSSIYASFVAPFHKGKKQKNPSAPASYLPFSPVTESIQVMLSIIQNYLFLSFCLPFKFYFLWVFGWPFWRIHPDLSRNTLFVCSLLYFNVCTDIIKEKFQIIIFMFLRFIQLAFFHSILNSLANIFFFPEIGKYWIIIIQSCI